MAECSHAMENSMSVSVKMVLCTLKSSACPRTGPFTVIVDAPRKQKRLDRPTAAKCPPNCTAPHSHFPCLPCPPCVCTTTSSNSTTPSRSTPPAPSPPPAASSKTRQRPQRSPPLHAHVLAAPTAASSPSSLSSSFSSSAVGASTTSPPHATVSADPVATCPSPTTPPSPRRIGLGTPRATKHSPAVKQSQT
jgi:hypothetical protein